MNYKLDWLFKKDIQKIFEVFLSKTQKFYVVGGSVRNSILSTSISDVDFATNLKPQKIIETANENNIKVVTLSLKHGTMIIVLNNKKYHISSFRKDILCDGRHALVEFTNNIKDDASRRDFTINSLYLTKDGKIIDPLNSIEDVEKRKIKFIGNSDLRIKEDYLRILRFFRFSALYSNENYNFDKDALKACFENRTGLLTISKERIFEEFKKIILSPDPAKVLQQMHKFQILQIILNNYDLSNLSVLVKNEKKFFKKENFYLRFLFLNFKNIFKIESYFPLTKHHKKVIIMFRKFLQKKISFEEIGYRYGARFGLIFLIVQESIIGKVVKKDDYYKVIYGSKQIFPIRGEDLLKNNIKLDHVRKKMNSLEEIWINSKYSFSKEDLLKRLI